MPVPSLPPSLCCRISATAGVLCFVLYIGYRGRAWHDRHDVFVVRVLPRACRLRILTCRLADRCHLRA